MASSSSPSKIPPKIPTRTSSRKKTSKNEKKEPYSENSIEHLQFLESQYETARKRIKPSHSLDANYWISASDASELSAKIYEVKTKRAIKQWREDESNEDGTAKGWWSTLQARELIDKLKAATYEKKMYKKQAEKIQQKSSLTHTFLALFNTSQLGLAIKDAGFGKRNRSAQSHFRQALISSYNAAITDPKKPKVIKRLYDTATGHELRLNNITAAHIIPHSLGPHILVSIFGHNITGELNTPYNGLLLASDVEKAMDDGAIAIVPAIVDDPSTADVEAWENTNPKQYKWRVIDYKADVLDACPIDDNEMTVRDLDGKQLFFKSDERPRARYLYFLFVVAQLKLAWRAEYRNDPSKVLKKQLRKGFWGTKGRYLKHAFLLALADEIGHDTELACADNAIDPGDNNERDELGVIGIAKLLQFRKRRHNEDDDDDEEQESKE